MNAQIVTLYRGLAIPKGDARRTESRIRSEGISGIDGQWEFPFPDIPHVRASLEPLFHKPDLTRDHVLANSHFSAFCACGTEAGAAYYALRHNRTASQNHPLVIEFTVSIDNICVDPRDFLCTAFQFWDRQSSSHRAWQSTVLCQLFGPAISRYFDACQATDQARRIAMCNLAGFDPAVTLSHLQNQRVIASSSPRRSSSKLRYLPTKFLGCMSR